MQNKEFSYKRGTLFCLLTGVTLSACGGGSSGNGNSSITDNGNENTSGTAALPVVIPANGSTASNGITGGTIVLSPEGDPASPTGGSIGNIRTPLSEADFANQFSVPASRQSIGADPCNK